MQTTCEHFSISSDKDRFASATTPNFWSKSISWRVGWIEPLCCHSAPSEYYAKCQRVMRNCVYGISFKGELSRWTWKNSLVGIHRLWHFKRLQERCRRVHCFVREIHFSNSRIRKVKCPIPRTHSKHFRSKKRFEDLRIKKCHIEIMFRQVELYMQAFEKWLNASLGVNGRRTGIDWMSTTELNFQRFNHFICSHFNW